MPKRRAFKFLAEYIEAIHDEGIVLIWPDEEPVHHNDVLDRNLLHSAVEQPFQGGFGVEYFYPTIYDKAACMFFSIAGGHIFGNGNKRTAVLAVDQFLAANSIYLLLSNEEIYELAMRTARHGENNENPDDLKALIAKQIRENSVTFGQIKKRQVGFYRELIRVKKLIREWNTEE